MKRRLNLRDGSTPSEEPKEHPGLPKTSIPPAASPQPHPTATFVTIRPVVITEDNRQQIYLQLGRRVCPDCMLGGMMTQRTSGTKTRFFCQECDAMFEADWSFGLDVVSGPKVTRLRRCPACQGAGHYQCLLGGLVSETICPTCNGTGRLSV